MRSRRNGSAERRRSLLYVLFSYDGRINRSTFWLKGILPLVGLSLLSYGMLFLVSFVYGL